MTRRHLARYLRTDRGAATAEYAVVSVAAAGLGGLLLKLLTSDWFADILRKIFTAIITMFLSAIGLGMTAEAPASAAPAGTTRPARGPVPAAGGGLAQTGAATVEAAVTLLGLGVGAHRSSAPVPRGPRRTAARERRSAGGGPAGGPGTARRRRPRRGAPGRTRRQRRAQPGGRAPPASGLSSWRGQLKLSPPLGPFSGVGGTGRQRARRLALLETLCEVLGGRPGRLRLHRRRRWDRRAAAGLRRRGRRQRPRRHREPGRYGRRPRRPRVGPAAASGSGAACERAAAIAAANRARLQSCRIGPGPAGSAGPLDADVVVTAEVLGPMRAVGAVPAGVSRCRRYVLSRPRRPTPLTARSPAHRSRVAPSATGGRGRRRPGRREHAHRAGLVQRVVAVAALGRLHARRAAALALAAGDGRPGGLQPRSQHARSRARRSRRRRDGRRRRRSSPSPVSGCSAVDSPPRSQRSQVASSGRIPIAACSAACSEPGSVGVVDLGPLHRRSSRVNHTARVRSCRAGRSSGNSASTSPVPSRRRW